MNLKKLSIVALAGMILAGCTTANTTEPIAQANDDQNINKAAIKGTTLNLYTWDGMFPQDVLDAFTQEYGVSINYSNFDYDEDMLAKVAEAKGGDYDVVIADDYILELVNQQGLSQKLNQSKIENLKNLNPAYSGLFFDPENEYNVAYGAGIPLIVYDPSVVDFEMKSYNDLWNESLKSNVAVIGNARVVNGIALKTLGYSFNTINPEELAQAQEKLLKLAPNIRAISDSNTQDLLLSGEVAAAFMYTSQVTQALTANPELKVVYPSEGLGFGVMAMFIPSQAPNAEAAHAFINYLLRPQVAAKCSEHIGYYATNKAAEEYISDEMKQFIVLPEDAVIGEAIQNVPTEIVDIHTKMFTDFQNATN